MPFGGGTFKSGVYDKIIPGVYANFENISSLEDNLTTGVVVFAIPFVSVDRTEGKTYAEPNVTRVTKLTYRTEISKFANELFYPVADLLKQCQEIFNYASVVYLVPLRGEATYTKKDIPIPDQYACRISDPIEIPSDFKFICTDTETDLERKLTNYDYNILLMNDYFNTGFSITWDYYYVNPIFSLFQKFIESSNKRFQILFRTTNSDLKKLLYDLEQYKKYKKWFLLPYAADSSYYLAGFLSTLKPGQSAAGHLYQGNWENITDWIPKTLLEQEESLKKGQISFYNIGLTNLRILKDITLVHSTVTENFDYNDMMGQIIRLEKYMYDWFSSLYVRSIQGYPNNESYRGILHGIIYDKLKELETEDVIQDVEPSHVTVSPIEGQPNAILIEIQYKPVSGIDFIYINFWVD